MDVTPTGNLGAGIGARAVYGNANFLTGDIAEILIYDTALSSTDRQAVEQYLSDKWFTPVPEPSSIVFLLTALSFVASTFLRRFS